MGEGGAAANGGVAVGPELVPERRVGVVEGCSAEDVEGVLGGGLRVGDEAVDGFLAVDIGGVFLAAADGGVDGLGEGAEKRERKQQDGGGGPVVLRGDAPTGPETMQCPADKQIADQEKRKAADKAQEEA